MSTQNARLLHWLETHGSISTREAMHSLEIYRVSERIRELERLGFVFDHKPETTDNGARIMRYVLITGESSPYEARQTDAVTSNQLSVIGSDKSCVGVNRKADSIYAAAGEQVAHPTEKIAA